MVTSSTTGVAAGGPADVDAIASIEAFLTTALEHQVIDPATRTRLVHELHALHSVPPQPPPALPAPRPPASPPRPYVPPAPRPSVGPPKTYVPAPRPARAPRPALPPRPEPPQWRIDAARWWRRTRDTIGSDVSVNGLAYLGVLLLFAGLLGFVVFAFGDVSPWARPLAEVAVPSTFFGAAWLLRRRGSALVPRLLVGLGGALAPFVLVTAFVDGSDLPPDATGGALQALLAGSLLALAVLYVWHSRRHPESALSWLPAPVLWLAVTYAAAATVPGWHGQRDDVVQPHPWQMSFTALAVLATALAARAVPASVLAKRASAAALPGMLVVASLHLAASWGVWPRWPLFSLLLTIALLTEVEAPRIPPTWVGPLQTVLVGLAAVAVLPDFQQEWWAVGVTAVALGLVEFEGRRRPSIHTTAVALAMAVATFTVAALQPWSGLSLSLAVAAWTAVRSRHGAAWLPPTSLLTGTAVAMPMLAAAELHRAVEPALATLLCASLVTVVAVAAARWWPHDRVLHFSVAGGAVAFLAVTAVEHVQGGSLRLLVAAACVATASIVVVPLHAELRAVLLGPSLVWTGALAAELFDIGVPNRFAVLSTLGALAVVGAVAMPRSGAVAAHAQGLVATATGVAAGWGRGAHWDLTVALAATTVAWGTTAWAERQGSTRLGAALAPDRKRQDAGILGPVAAGLAAVALPALVLQAALDAGRPTRTVVDVLTVVVLIAAAETAVARWLPLHRLQQQVLAHTGLALSLPAFAVVDWPQALVVHVAVFAALVVADTPGRWEPWWWVAWAGMARASAWAVSEVTHRAGPFGVAGVVWGLAVVTGALVLAVREVPARRIRPPVAVGLAVAVAALVPSAIAGRGWLGSTMVLWAVATMVWAVLLRLPILTALTWVAATAAYEYLAPWVPHEHPWTLVAWGLAMATAAVVTGRVSLARAPVSRGGWPRAVLGFTVLPAFVVGSAVALAATVLAAADWRGWFGWSMALWAVATLAWAVLLRLPVLTYATWATATAAYECLAPWVPHERPWSFVAWAGVLVVAAGVVHRTVDRGKGFGPWYGPLMAAAGASAVVALAWVPEAGFRSYTLLAVALLMLAVQLERSEPAWWFAAAAFLDVAAGGEGRRWLALVLAAEGAALVAAAVRTRDMWRRGFYLGGVACIVAAAAVDASRLRWSDDSWMVAIALVGGGLVLAGAVSVRLTRRALDWALPWVAIGVLLVIAASLWLSTPGHAQVVQRALALGWSLIAAGSALDRSVLPKAQLQWPAVGTLLISLGCAAAGFQLAATTVWWGAAVLAGVTLGSALMIWTVREESVWTLPLLSAVVVLDVAAGAAALQVHPLRHALVPVLVVVGAELAAAGLVLRLPALTITSPPVLCAAWLTFAADVALGNAQWYTVPIGLLLLLDVALTRRMTPADFVARTRSSLAAAEIAGMAFVVGAAVLQILAGRPWSGVLAILFGVLLAAWGAVTKVRRRAVFGAASVVVSATLLVVVPLTAFISEQEHLFEGGALWLVIAGVGLIALLVAAFLEQGRVRVRRAVERLRDLMADWE